MQLARFQNTLSHFTLHISLSQCDALQTRNRLAFFLSDSTRMPEVTASSCDRCYARTECAVVHRLAEGGEKHAGLDAAKWEEEIDGLTDAHAAYFKDMVGYPLSSPSPVQSPP